MSSARIDESILFVFDPEEPSPTKPDEHKRVEINVDSPSHGLAQKQVEQIFVGGYF